MPTASTTSTWLEENLACPYDGDHVTLSDRARCPQGHVFPLYDGIPVMLVDEPATLWVADASRRVAEAGQELPLDVLALQTVGFTPEERDAFQHDDAANAVEKVVRYIVGATCGNLYRPLVGKLARYPIPELRLPASDGAVLVDIGCNWGRWSIAAARKGYRVIGVDPSLGAVVTARRISREMGLDVGYLVGDARCLPLRRSSVDVVFSYSVLQHFSRTDVSRCLSAFAGVLRDGGDAVVQMPNKFGLRSGSTLVRRRFAEGEGFAVRYWSLPELRRVFGEAIGPVTVTIDCFFGLGIQPSDRAMLRPLHRMIVSASELLRHVADFLPPLVYVADSVYIHAHKHES